MTDVENAQDDRLSVLIADDNQTDRMILETILHKEGHRVFAAKDGVEAVKLFKEHEIHIVLLDALMPEMDGYEAAEQIKALAGEKLVPIIFLTSLKEAPALARCLEVGGDDFLTKPYNKIILQAKLNASSRLAGLYSTVQQQRDEIQYHTDRLVHEQSVAKKVFDNIAHRGCLDSGNIRYVLSPMSIFNGDLLLAAPKPSGGLHLLLGDFTGHGLPAAIGAMPVSEIFYGMTLKGFVVADIMVEVNKRLVNILPRGVFCCAIAVDIDFQNDIIQFWNGGLPEGFILREGEGKVTTIPSKNLPLGIVAQNNFRSEMQVETFKRGDKLYMFSDGIIEATNAKGDMYGEDRLREIIDQHGESGSVFDPVISSLNNFRGNYEQDDDITFVEVTCEDAKSDIQEKVSGGQDLQGPLDWRLDYELRPRTLKTFDPLPLVLQVLMETPALRPHRGKVFTILAELYSNALDHGILKLDSQLKSSPDGFASYYEKRAERLDNLTDARLRLSVELLAETSNSGVLYFLFEDSGEGFDFSTSKDMKKNEGYSGRGIPLIRTLCESVEFFGKGNKVEAVYRWSAG